MKAGLALSFGDPDNGMTRGDMEAATRSAQTLGELIVFRSTGPWAKRWLELGYPSKNFHVKGKSSDWGPQAGLVPFLGEYSKVGHIKAEAEDGTAKNRDGEHSGAAARTQLVLTRDQISVQQNRPEQSPPRTALDQVIAVEGTESLVLVARRPGDGRTVCFVARKQANSQAFAIFAPPMEGTNASPVLVVDRLKSGRAEQLRLTPFEVMASRESGADLKPMTGDYDLLAVCPTWADYMSRSTRVIAKDGIVNLGRNGGAPEVQPGQSFGKGSFMDKVIDTRLTTGRAVNKVAKAKTDSWDEHPDMGNLTPRILRAINQLNVDMGAVGPRSALRRVHHNAESHRHAMFGALKGAKMNAVGEGFPFTVFAPESAMRTGPLARYQDVCTLDDMTEFKSWATAAHQAGFYVPKNWTWGMSIRDDADLKNTFAGGRFA
jgi:hypothetical protein